ncbi:MAG: flippase [Gemmatimonadota bacterium]
MRLGVVRNLAYSGAGALSSLLLFGLFVLAARELGDATFGLFSYALAFVFLFDYLADFGVSDIVIRELARAPREAPRYLANLLGYRTLLGLAVYGAILLAIHVVNDDPRAVRLVAILGLGFVLRPLLLTGRCFFRAFERWDLDAAVLTLDRLLLLLAGGTVVVVTRSPEALAWTFVAVRLVLAGVNLVLLRPLVRLGRPRLEWPFLMSLQRQALAIGGFQVVIGAATYVDAIMLEFWRPYEEIGWYSAAYRIYLGAAMLPATLLGVFAPRLARLFTTESPRAHQALAASVARFAWPAGVGLALLAAVGAPSWVHLAYGAEYAPAALPLAILGAGLLAVSASIFFNVVLISIDRQNRAFGIALAGLALNVAVNLVVIPRWGFVGAAAATLLSELLIVALFAAVLRRDYGRVPGLATLGKALLAAAAALPAVLLPGLEPALRALLAVALYLVVLALLGVPDAEERRRAGAWVGTLRRGRAGEPRPRNAEEREESLTHVPVGDA